MLKEVQEDIGEGHSVQGLRGDGVEAWRRNITQIFDSIYPTRGLHEGQLNGTELFAKQHCHFAPFNTGSQHPLPVIEDAQVTTMSRNHSSGLGLLARTLDEFAQVADRKVQWEVNAGQQLDEEKIPSQYRDGEEQATRCVLSFKSCRQSIRCSLGNLPEGSREGGKGGYEQQEDREEDDVGPERADEEDEAQKAQVEREIGKSGREDRVAGRRGRVCGVVGNCRVKVRCKGGRVGEPESTEGSEDDEGKGVAEDELEDGGDYHQ
jgi:hypothetical protein